MIAKTVSLYKRAYGGLSPGTWWLSLVMVVNRSGTMVIPFMTMYLTQQYGVNIEKAGFVMSLFGLGAILGALAGGKLIDRLGYYFVQMFALVFGGIMFITLGQMHSYTAICICVFILAVINESFRPANTVAIAHYSKEQNRTRSYSLNRLAINVGWAAGGALGGILASFNYGLLFWVDGLTNLAAAIVLYITLSPKRNPATEVKSKEKPEAAASVYKDKIYLSFIVLVFFFALCFFQLFTTIPVFFKVSFHLSILFIGMVMALNGLIIAVFEMITIFSLEGKRPPLHFISGGVLMVSAAFVLLNLPYLNTGVVAIGCMLILTVGEILAMPFMNAYWISRTRPNNRGQYAALYSVAWASAQTVGPYAGSLVAEHASYKTLWIIAGAVCFMLAIFYRRLQPPPAVLSV
ncbi:MAG TPA: MFS transporter [Chitinophagaceae bacterium]|nr:MFS transporter [Chitinophagaceae bacterium]